MRTIIVFFIALFAIAIVQVAIGPQLERTGAPALIDRSNKIILAIRKHLWAPDIEYPNRPKMGASVKGELT
jgi:hypothetical protein